ncbi:MAG: hypothetical protein HY286_01095 [Planctomycetes bacterium]|nr:hypothetical protein [Planctomycetota bacterium]
MILTLNGIHNSRSLRIDYPIVFRCQAFISLLGVGTILGIVFTLLRARWDFGHWPTTASPAFGLPPFDPPPTIYPIASTLASFLYITLVVATPFVIILNFVSIVCILAERKLRDPLTLWVAVCVFIYVLLYIPLFVQVPDSIGWLLG